MVLYYYLINRQKPPVIIF